MAVLVWTDGFEVAGASQGVEQDVGGLLMGAAPFGQLVGGQLLTGQGFEHLGPSRHHHGASQ